MLDADGGCAGGCRGPAATRFRRGAPTLAGGDEYLSRADSSERWDDPLDHRSFIVWWEPGADDGTEA